MSDPQPSISWSDYSRAFAEHRLDDRQVESWVRRFVERGRLAPGTRLADIGCGVGRYALRLASVLGVPVIAVDSAPEMLAEMCARNPDGWAKPLLASAEALPLADDCVDAVLMSMSLHQFDRPMAALREARRVLRPGGRLIALTSTQSQVNFMDTLVYRFFPSARRLDRVRMPSLGVLANRLRDAGFGRTDIRQFHERQARTGREWIALFAGKPCSTLYLLADAEYKAGMARLRQSLADEQTYEEEMQFTLLVAFV
jgi:ubiquinone/menaquinone biosynthesis C-methylase UbiE